LESPGDLSVFEERGFFVFGVEEIYFFPLTPFPWLSPLERVLYPFSSFLPPEVSYRSFG